MKLECIKNTIEMNRNRTEELLNKDNLTKHLPFTVGKVYEVFFQFDEQLMIPRITVFTDRQVWATFKGEGYLQLFKPLN